MSEIDDLNSRVAHVKSYAQALVAGMWIMDQRRHMLKPLIDDLEIREAIVRKFDGSCGAQAYQNGGSSRKMREQGLANHKPANQKTI